jgi:hypothetical protein
LGAGEMSENEKREKEHYSHTLFCSLEWIYSLVLNSACLYTQSKGYKNVSLKRILIKVKRI